MNKGGVSFPAAKATIKAVICLLLPYVELTAWYLPYFTSDDVNFFLSLFKVAIDCDLVEVPHLIYT